MIDLRTIEFITDGRNGKNERVVLWRTGEYTYELDIGTGLSKKTLKFYETEFGEAIGYFDAMVANYTEYA
jgi:hypothetical protein